MSVGTVALLVGCAGAPQTQPPSSATAPSARVAAISREFDAEVFAVRPTGKEVQTYEVAFRPRNSDEAIIVELRWNDPFLTQGLGLNGAGDPSKLRPGWRSFFPVRLELVPNMLGLSSWRLAAWSRPTGGP
jgi:hypothetical protein